MFVFVCISLSLSFNSVETYLTPHRLQTCKPLHITFTLNIEKGQKLSQNHTHTHTHTRPATLSQNVKANKNYISTYFSPKAFHTSLYFYPHLTPFDPQFFALSLSVTSLPALNQKNRLAGGWHESPTVNSVKAYLSFSLNVCFLCFSTYSVESIHLNV